MTIGHRVAEENPMKLHVRAGEWDTQTIREPLPSVESNVASIEVHKDFNKKNVINNIALLFLETPFQNAQHINTICLPPPHLNFDGQR